MTDLIDTISWLVDVPSVTGDEARLRDEIAARLGQMPQRSIADSLVVGDPGSGAVLLAGHLDTVPLQGDLGVRVEGDRVHGLGATDMKGGLAVMIHLLEVLGPALVTGVFYAGEEGPLSGNQLGRVLDEAEWLRDAPAGIVLEPTDRGLEAGCQGVVNASVVFLGEPAHSARPWLGDNAITKAGEFLTSMRRLEPELHVIEGLAVKPYSLTFGKTGGEKSYIGCHKHGIDVNADGLLDLVCTFDNQVANWEVDDVRGVMKGVTEDGTKFEGRGRLKVVPKVRD